MRKNGHDLNAIEHLTASAEAGTAFWFTIKFLIFMLTFPTTSYLEFWESSSLSHDIYFLFFSFLFTGIMTALLTNPIWVVKTRMCAQKAGDIDAYRGLYGNKSHFSLIFFSLL